MEINALNNKFFNSQYVPLSAPASSTPGLNNTGSASFADILKKAQDTQSKGTPVSPAMRKPPIDKNDKLYELCMELETFLIKNLVKSMRSTVQKSKLIDSGFAGEIYEDMLYDEYAKDFARNANFGFAEMAYRELSGQR